VRRDSLQICFIFLLYFATADLKVALAGAKMVRPTVPIIIVLFTNLSVSSLAQTAYGPPVQSTAMMPPLVVTAPPPPPMMVTAPPAPPMRYELGGGFVDLERPRTDGAALLKGPTNFRHRAYSRSIPTWRNSPNHRLNGRSRYLNSSLRERAKATTPTPSDIAKDAAALANKNATNGDTATKPDTAAQPAQDAVVPANEGTAENDNKADTTAEPNQTPPSDIAKDAAAPANKNATNGNTATKPDTAAQPAQDAVVPANEGTAENDNKADTTAEPNQPTPAGEQAKAAVVFGEKLTPVTIDTLIARRLHNLIVGNRLDGLVTREIDRDGVEQYYRAHDYKPIWISNGEANARAKAAIAYLGQVETVGLDSRDYPSPHFAARVTPDALAEAELRLTASVLIYAHDAQIGRIHFTRVGPDISFKLTSPKPAEVLVKVADSQDTAQALDSYNPPQAGFRALKEKLAELRANADTISKPEKKPEIIHLPGGKNLRDGMKGARVVALRKRLDIAAKSKLANKINTIIVNMERWRWLPRKLGNDQNAYVIVNVPDYTLSLFRDGELYWNTKIVVGKPGKATPMTSAKINSITVNPIWNVPPSIIKAEYLPELKRDPTIFYRHGLKFHQDADGTVHIYQPPGAGNALGRIRFNFPNKFLVYQHDTPEKYLFKRTKRAYSHGCMRVQDPIEYAVKLLSIELPQDHYTSVELEGMYGSNEININFPRPIPVHLTYQTAFVDENGKLQFRDDIYGRDARMIQILDSSARKVAYIPLDWPRNTSNSPVRLPVRTYGRSRHAQAVDRPSALPHSRLEKASDRPTQPIVRLLSHVLGDLFTVRGHRTD